MFQSRLEEVGEAGENPRRHKEKVQGQGNEQATFFLWGASANHCTAVLAFVIINYFQIWEKNNSSRIEVIHRPLNNIRPNIQSKILDDLEMEPVPLKRCIPYKNNNIVQSQTVCYCMLNSIKQKHWKLKTEILKKNACNYNSGWASSLPS